MGPQSPHAPPAGADTLHQGPGETPQKEPLPQKDLWIRRKSPMRGPLLPDEEEDRRRGIPHSRGLAQKGGPQAQEEPAALRRRPRPGGGNRRHQPAGVEQQGPP